MAGLPDGQAAKVLSGRMLSSMDRSSFVLEPFSCPT